MINSYIYCGSEDKYDWDTLFQECFPIDNIARKHMIQVINELRQRVSNTEKMTQHHIIPRCFYEYKNLKCDNSQNNLIYVTQEEHLFLHSCAVACCNYNLKSKLKQPVIAMLGYWKDAQKEGIRRYVANGGKMGPPPKQRPAESIWKPIIEKVNANEMTVREALSILNLKRTTFYKLFMNELNRDRNVYSRTMSAMRTNSVHSSSSSLTTLSSPTE